MDQITQGKWEAQGTFILADTGKFRLMLVDGIGLKEIKQNVRHICKCVNTHDELIKTCNDLLNNAKDNNVYNDDILEKLQTIINKVEG